MPLQRFSHTGGAPATGLSSSITSSQTSFAILSGTGYPTGSGGPFIIVIDQGTASEEKILVSGISSNTVTVAVGGRGYDNTTAASHQAGSTNIQAVFGAVEADDANAHIYTTSRDDHTQYASITGSRAKVSRYGLSGAQAVGSTATLQFNTLVFDTLTGYNTSTWDLVVPYTGYYRVSIFAGSATSGYNLEIYHNGAVYSAGPNDNACVATGGRIATIADIVSCTANDTLSAVIVPSGALSVINNGNTTFVQYELIN